MLYIKLFYQISKKHNSSKLDFLEKLCYNKKSFYVRREEKMIADTTLKLAIYFNELPDEIKFNILIAIMIVQIIGCILFAIYLSRLDK